MHHHTRTGSTIRFSTAIFLNGTYRTLIPLRAHDIEPKAIRHALFNGPAPFGMTPLALTAFLSLLAGKPIEEAADTWVQWQTNVPTMKAERDVQLPFGPHEDTGF